MILNDILDHKKIEVEATKKVVPLEFLRGKALQLRSIQPRFLSQIKANPGIALIAEVKKASPSRGVIREEFHPVELAKIYESSGATCLSVLTDKKFFQGELLYLELIRQAVELPLLRKDFIIDEYQLYEAKLAGADAILLIAAALDDAQLGALYRRARELSLDVLVEVHTREEMQRAMDLKFELIGINNRDLQTFEVSLQTSFDLIKWALGYSSQIGHTPEFVSESGISKHSQVKELEAAGFKAILVGEGLMREKDLAAATIQLIRG